MIQVRVRDDHGIQAAGVKGKVVAVIFFIAAEALGHAALKQHLAPIGLQQVTGTGNLLGCT